MKKGTNKRTEMCTEPKEEESGRRKGVNEKGNNDRK